MPIETWPGQSVDKPLIVVHRRNFWANSKLDSEFVSNPNMEFLVSFFQGIFAYILKGVVTLFVSIRGFIFESFRISFFERFFDRVHSFSSWIFGSICYPCNSVI